MVEKCPQTLIYRLTVSDAIRAVGSRPAPWFERITEPSQRNATYRTVRITLFSYVARVHPRINVKNLLSVFTQKINDVRVLSPFDAVKLGKNVFHCGFSSNCVMISKYKWNKFWSRLSCLIKQISWIQKFKNISWLLSSQLSYTNKTMRRYTKQSISIYISAPDCAIRAYGRFLVKFYDEHYRAGISWIVICCITVIYYNSSVLRTHLNPYKNRNFDIIDS